MDLDAAVIRYGLEIEFFTDLELGGLPRDREILAFCQLAIARRKEMSKRLSSQPEVSDELLDYLFYKEVFSFLCSRNVGDFNPQNISTWDFPSTRVTLRNRFLEIYNAAKSQPHESQDKSLTQLQFSSVEVSDALARLIVEQLPHEVRSLSSAPLTHLVGRLGEVLASAQRFESPVALECLGLLATIEAALEEEQSGRSNEEARNRVEAIMLKARLTLGRQLAPSVDKDFTDFKG
jgi:hypothetical protein